MSHDTPKSEYPAVRYTTAVLKGIGARPYQEDTCLIAEAADGQLMLAMIADGMGGMQDGRLASRTAVGIVRQSFRRFDAQGDIPAQLCDALKRANDVLYSQLRSEGGTTGVVCVFTPQGMYYAGVGDSFLMLRRGRIVYHLNRRQNVYYDLCARQIRGGSMSRSFAENHPQRSALTTYLGMKSLRDIDCYLRPLPLLPGDRILLCSDGIGDVLSDAELLECLSASTADGSCRRIDERIYEIAGRHQDNYSAVVVKCGAGYEGAVR